MSDGVDHLRPPVDELTRVPRRPRRRGWRLLSALATLVVVVLVVVLASVLRPGSTSKTGSGLVPQLTGGPWSLDSITAAGSTWTAPAGNRFALTFTEKGYTGNDSCNSTGGTVSYGAGTVRLGAGPMTAMGCVGGDQSRMQDAFQLLLSKDLPASVSDAVLTITAGQTVFALSRVQPAAAADLRKALPGTTWSLVAVGKTGTDVSSSSVPADVHANIAFRTQDYSASDGCNRHDGDISYAAATVTFSGGGTSEVRCEGPSGQYGSLFSAILQGTVKPTIVGDTLTLATATSSLTFARARLSGQAAGLEQQLTDSTWKLMSIKTASGASQSLARTGTELTFTAGTIRASDSCNALETQITYDATAPRVDIIRGANGIAACSYPPPGPPPGTLAPQAFFDALDGPMDVVLDGKALTLAKAGVALHFSRSDAKESPTVSSPSPGPATTSIPPLVDQLVGWFWQIKSTTLNGVTTVAPSGSRAAINFSKDDLDACDDTGADWHSSEGATYGQASITMHSMVVSATPYQGTRIEDAYTAVLRDTVSANVVGTTLTLSAHGGVLVYTRAHAAPYKSDFLATD